MTEETTLRLPARIWHEEHGYVSLCPELGVASCGGSYDHALEMLREAVELHVEDMDRDELLLRVHPEAAQFPLTVTVPAA